MNQNCTIKNNDLKALDVEVAALDVTDEKSITVCVDSVIAKAGRIDMLVNKSRSSSVSERIRLSSIAKFPRAFIDKLLSKKFGLDRLRNGRKMTG